MAGSGLLASVLDKAKELAAEARAAMGGPGEEEAEAVGYETIAALLGQASQLSTQAGSLIGDLANPQEGATPDEEAETAVENATLDSARALMQSAMGALGAACGRIDAMRRTYPSAYPSYLQAGGGEEGAEGEEGARAACSCEKKDEGGSPKFKRL